MTQGSYLKAMTLSLKCPNLSFLAKDECEDERLTWLLDLHKRRPLLPNLTLPEYPVTPEAALRRQGAPVTPYYRQGQVWSCMGFSPTVMVEDPNLDRLSIHTRSHACLYQRTIDGENRDKCKNICDLTFKTSDYLKKPVLNLCLN
ncbi:hypothetical protein J6590_068314 [Homalodisca vitripennis]|nr:hypothetical protein J6590_068314 [Homalodisca vitripennis]